MKYHSKCKLELRLKWTKYCALSAAGVDNVNGNDSDNNITFTIKETKLYVPVVTLSRRDNQKLSKPLGKGFKRPVYWNEYKTKIKNKNATNKFRFFLESNFAGVERFFILVHSKQDSVSKRFKIQRYYLPKSIIKIHNVIIRGKNFWPSSWFRYKTMRRY